MTFPHSVARYFWGDNLQEMSVGKHAKYIIQTLLEKGDTKALRWLFSIVPPQSVRKSKVLCKRDDFVGKNGPFTQNADMLQSVKAMLPELKLSKKSAHFWQVYLASVKQP